MECDSAIKRNDTCYNMDGPWIHYTKSKKSDIKSHYFMILLI